MFAEGFGDRLPHVAWKVWFDTIIREYRLNYGGSKKALNKVQKVVDEYLPDIGDEDGFKCCHRIVDTQTHEYKIFIEIHEYVFGNWQLKARDARVERRLRSVLFLSFLSFFLPRTARARSQEYDPEEDFMDDLKAIEHVTGVAALNSTIQQCWPEIAVKIDPPCEHCGQDKPKPPPIKPKKEKPKKPKKAAPDAFAPF